jgi:uncharacterized membrane protein YcgQ (UPF0703/DUF1980 family)
VNGPGELTVQMTLAKDPFVRFHTGRGTDKPLIVETEEIDPDQYDTADFIESDLQRLYTVPDFRKGKHGVAVEGLVYKPPEDEIPPLLHDGEQKVLLIHFVMVCCAADSIPRVVLLNGIEPEEMTENTWIKAWGVTSLIAGDTSAEIMTITVIRHKKLTRPTYPYLRP